MLSEPVVKAFLFLSFCSFLVASDPTTTSADPNNASLTVTTNFPGSWRLDSPNAGVSAMHMQLMPNNKVVWFDSTGTGLSEIRNDPPFCTGRVGGRPTDPPLDCTAHAIEYDADTAQIRTLLLPSNPWCSSGGLTKDGDFLGTGGYMDGVRSVLKLCPNCQFNKSNTRLLADRWYATNHALEDGSFVVIGGRHSFNYEIIPGDTLDFVPILKPLEFLSQTNDETLENNLYPFVNLLPDGNLFVFANYKSIVLNPRTGDILRTFPDFTFSRNYPPSAMSALLPIDLSSKGTPEFEVIICGGNTRDAFLYSGLQPDPKNQKFLPALKDCGRLNLLDPNPQWDTEEMPSPRVMGDMLILPTGDLLLINGAKAGTSAWNAAADPNLTPVLYMPKNQKDSRFLELAPTTIPRMYHASSAVLPSGEILIAGSNTNPYYMLPKYNDTFVFPTELRVEKFTPPYLDPALQKWRVRILNGEAIAKLSYGMAFTAVVDSNLTSPEVKVTMYSPPFTSHGYSQNQRLLILNVMDVRDGNRIVAMAPPSGKLAPPGFYLLFVVRRGVPSRGVWVKIN